MSENIKRKTRRRRITLKDVKENSETDLQRKGKKVPGGLCALFHSLAVAWPPEEKERGLSEFATLNFGKYNQVAQDLDSKGYAKQKALYDHLYKICIGTATPNFIDMKFFADYMGVPVGVLLLISQFIGAELIKKQSALRDYEDKLIDIMTRFGFLKSQIFSPDGHAFVKIDKKSDSPELDMEKMYNIVYKLFDKPEHIREREDLNWLNRRRETMQDQPARTQLIPSPQ